MTPHSPGFLNMIKKRLLAFLLILPFLVNSAEGSALAQGFPIESHEEITAQRLDKRVEILQAYLAKYNSPLQHQAKNFVEAADAHGLDWRLVASIAGVESTFGKFMPGGTGPYTSYNAWGWGVYGTQAIYFKSWREGIFTVSEGLRKNYANRGLTTPAAINRAYSTSPAWAGSVVYFLNDIENFRAEYEKSNPELGYSTMIQTAGVSGLLATR